ncbi:pyocin activator PrtN family protein [Vreelandella sp. EE7]
MNEPMPNWDEAPVDNSTVGLLYQQFGKVMIPLEDVRTALFRNRSAERFRRALRERTIPLPVIVLDGSQKGIAFVCIYQLAAFLEHHAVESARAREVLFTTPKAERRLRQRMIDAVPTTQFRDVANATPQTPA